MKGNVADDPLPTLLHPLFTQQATGVLRLQNRAGKHEIFLRGGYPVAVTLPGSVELLGKVLFEMGLLDEATYKETLAAPLAPGQRYGQFLLDQQRVTEEQIRLALKAQVRRKLHRLFFIEDASYEFLAGEHQEGLQRHESLRIQPTRAIYHGVRAAWSGERLEKALAPLSGRVVFCRLGPPEVARYGLGVDDARLAELLRKGHWALPDLIDAAGLPAQLVHAFVYALYVTDALELRGANEVPRLRKRTDPPVVGAPPVVLHDLSGAYRLPSRMTPLPKPPPNGPTPISTSPSATRLPMPAPPGVTGIPPGPPDVEEVRRQLLAKAQGVERQNLFEVLELTETATRDQIKQAYFVAAKRYHPDRLVSMGLESLRADVEKIFRRVSEAYGTLFDDARREEYRTTLGKPKEDDTAAHQKALRLLEADMASRRGEALLRSNDYLSAIRELEQAVQLDPESGDYLAFLTWARVCAGQTPHGEAKALFNQAIKLSPRCARAYYYLGVCLKEEKDIDRAYGLFKKAQELDSRLIDAEREMRLINMRREKQKPSGGFFDRFRKR